MIVDAMPKKAKNTVWDLELSIFFDHQVAPPDTDINNNISSELDVIINKDYMERD